MTDSATRTAHWLTALCAGMGVTHFVRPEPFDALIPRPLPGPARWWTLGSGVAELGVAALLANPSTRRLGGAAAGALFVGVYPGNLTMAWDSRHRSTPAKAIALGRLPLQFLLLRQASLVRREG